MKKFILLLSLLALLIQIPSSLPAAASKTAVESQQFVPPGKNTSATHPTKTTKKPTRTERRQKRLTKKLEKWETKIQGGDRISLAWLGVVVMLVGGLFIVLGVVIPYVGLLFLIVGIIIAFAGLLLTLLLGGLSVEKD